MEKRAVKE